ncbi:unnamed protein product, partial [Rotaria sordida]
GETWDLFALWIARLGGKVFIKMV